MKRIDFLIKLKGEGKLEIVESNDEIKQSYLKKSDSNLSSAKILFENDKMEEAVALTYYSMYNSLIALLFKVGIKSENHTASIILLKDVFGRDNSSISFAKKERLDKQYYVNFKIMKKQVKDAIGKAEEFNSKMRDFISKLTNDDICKYTNKFKRILNK